MKTKINIITFKHIAIFSLVLFLSSCDFLSTRTAEPPDGSNSGFVPPTSPDIVISNLTRAVNDLNVDDYISCFEENLYEFIPSSDVYGQYAGVFSTWTLQKERSYFSSLILEKKDESTTELLISDIDYEINSTDSSVIYASYSWDMKEDVRDYSIFNGSLRFTLCRDVSGLWYIKKWTDYSSSNETETWSRVKAIFSN